MTQEERDLLIKDLSGRLPYGVKGRVLSRDCNNRECEFGAIIDGKLYYRFAVAQELWFDNVIIKPYLYPLSSMTEEQKKEISKRYNYHNYYEGCVEITYHSQGYWDDDNSCNLQDYLWLEDWYNKNHFDYRGLIDKGLAIDATGLNIY